MAARAVSTRNDQKFPVGTVVGAYTPGYNRHHEGKPSGTAVETATVAANGVLTFPALPEGQYVLWGEPSAGVNANMALGNFAPVVLGTLRARVEARRAEWGC